jgi:NAD(P)-dependent dehydrogenase (short-subunit alcohol dehydrogenase family)
MSKKILITGASGGFGKLTTLTLLKEGHQVAATMRNVQTKNSEVAAELQAAGAQIVELDVTDDNSVTKGVNHAIEMLRGIDVVINNAGVGTIGMQEHFTPEDFKQLFDINVFGVQRVNRAVLPHMRERGNGLIIYVSSLLGRFALPFYGPYNTSKWAMEAMAENYRVELSGFGIDNCIVEPGGYPTTFMVNLMKPSDNSRTDSYGEFMNVPGQLASGFEQALANNPSQDPQNVADAIAKLVNSSAGERPFRTIADNMGMGAAIKPYNDMLEQVTAGIYGNFGMGDMLKLKV